MERDAEGLERGLAKVKELRAAFWEDVRVAGDARSLNQHLEHAGRVADFMEFAELMLADALHREESCGGHFRSEHQTADNEALRDDEQFAYAAAWQHAGPDAESVLHKEPLVFEEVMLATRSYK